MYTVILRCSDDSSVTVVAMDDDSLLKTIKAFTKSHSHGRITVTWTHSKSEDDAEPKGFKEGFIAVKSDKIPTEPRKVDPYPSCL